MMPSIVVGEKLPRRPCNLNEKLVFPLIYLTGENLLILCLDMFLAGLKTTSDTLSTLFLFLTLNPGWIKKLQDELDAVVGRNRSPTLDDMDSCPTIEAFLSEVLYHCESSDFECLIIEFCLSFQALRSLTLSPLAVPHKTTKDTQLEGYFIPKVKNIFTVLNLWFQWIHCCYFFFRIR